MTAPTHISFAGLLYLVFLTSAGVPLTVLNGIAALLASVLPDIDTGASSIGKLFPRASRWLERRFGHRTLTHSLPFTAALAIALIPLAIVQKEIYVCFLAGYASHPILDSCTMTGVRLLYPVSGVRCVFPMDVNEPMRYRINTGTRQETILAAVFLLGCVPSFYVAHQGLERFVRVARGNIEAAVRDFSEFSATNLVWVECRATSSFSKERLVGRYRAIGALDAQTLVIQTEGGKLKTLGREYRSDYAAQHAVCVKGEPARTTVERIDMSKNRVSDIVPYGETHLFGTLVLADEIPRVESPKNFTPLTASGHEVRLNYATPADLAALIGDRAIESGMLDVRRVIRAGFPDSGSAVRPGEAIELLQLQPEAELLFICAPGDTVRAGALLAAWDEQGTLRREVAETRRNLSALRLARLEKAEQMLAKEARADGAVRSDSIAWNSAAALQAIGFVPKTAVNDADARLRLARSTRAALQAERSAFEAEQEARRLALENRRKLCESKILPGIGRKEVLCKTGGVVVSVERKVPGIRITVRPL